MIIARYAHDSDVHVADDEAGGGMFCRQCRLNGGAHWPAFEPLAMHAHLYEHRVAGDQVNDDAFVELADRAGLLGTAVDVKRREPSMQQFQVPYAATWMGWGWWRDLLERIRWAFVRLFRRGASS